MKWSKLARRFESSEEISEGEFCDILAAFCSLQASMARAENFNAERILADAMMLDADLSDWADRCPTRNAWERITVSNRSADVLADYWDSYRDIGVAFAWNHYRTIRILVNQVICTQTRSLIDRLPNQLFRPPLEDQISESRQLITHLARDICASVPFFLGRHRLQNNSEYDMVYQPQNAVLGRILLWALYVAGNAVQQQMSLRRWIIARLERIAEMMEIHKASLLAQALTSESKVNWMGIKDIIGWQDLLNGVERTVTMKTT